MKINLKDLWRNLFLLYYPIFVTFMFIMIPSVISAFEKLHVTLDMKDPFQQGLLGVLVMGALGFYAALIMYALFWFFVLSSGIFSINVWMESITGD